MSEYNTNIIRGCAPIDSERIAKYEAKAKRVPLFACMECGKKFYNAAAAEKAAFGDNGCPECGGSDIDAI